jgi:hypothetical protein
VSELAHASLDLFVFSQLFYPGFFLRLVEEACLLLIKSTGQRNAAVKEPDEIE